ncbi:16912_t:CDS:2, partial [Acaulospora colombiana]
NSSGSDNLPKSKTLKPFYVSNPNSSENQNAILRKKSLEFLRNLLTEEEMQEMQDEHIKERCELVELLLQQFLLAVGVVPRTSFVCCGGARGVSSLRLTIPDAKKHKIDGLFKVIKAKQKNQAIIIVEFSFGRKAPLTKEDGDQVKLCQNSMRILNKLLQDVPKDKARVYLVQAVNGYIIIKYLVRSLPSIYILQKFTHIKIPVSFDDFEQFAKDMADLMNWQVEVLSTIKAINKESTGDNNIHITSVQDTPAKKTNNKNQPFPKSPPPDSTPLGSKSSGRDLMRYLDSPAHEKIDLNDL